MNTLKLSPAGWDRDQDYPWLHMNYINERKDIWYAGMGHIFIYHYLYDFADAFLTFYSSGEAIQQTLPLKVYPNPFKYQTRFRYTLLKHGHVRLSIFDSMGRLVRILVDEEQSEGPHELMLNAENLKPGMYFYNLETESIAQTGKLIRID